MAVAFAIVVFLRALAKRKQVLMQPLSIDVTAFVAAELIGPALVVISGLTALLSGNTAWYSSALLVAIAFAVISLF